MFYLTKFSILFLFLMGFQIGWAQEETEDSSRTSTSKNIVHITAGAFHPIAFGDNLANKALDKNTGISYAIMVRIPDTKYRLGFYFSGFKASVKSDAIPIVGNYSRSRIASLGIQFGYIFWEHSNWLAFVDGSVGYVVYSNSTEDFKFRDNGLSTILSPSLQYNFHKNIGLYTAVAVRHDFLRTKAPSNIKSFFRHQDYVNLNLGVVISF